VRRWRGRKMPPQPGSRWSRVSWAREFGSYRDLLDLLPDRVDRAEAARHARAAARAEGAVRAFLAAMIWGYGPVSHGPYRTARVLRENPDAAERLAGIARIARDEGGLAAFAHVEARPLRYLGVAFGTKYLYFCSTGTAPILDAVVCRWLSTHADLRLNIDTWRTADYKRYLDALADWSAQLSLPPGTVEELIFRDGISREGSATWGEDWASTDEPPEPAEIGNDAWQAIRQLQRLFGAMEPGIADEAQQHLSALASIRRPLRASGLALGGGRGRLSCVICGVPCIGPAVSPGAGGLCDTDRYPR
jgi:hypothetical protein